MIVLHLAALVIFLYLLLRLIIPLPLGWLAKIFLASSIFAISFKHYFIMKFFGGLASPDLPRMVLIVGGWLYGALVLLFVLLLAKDIITLFVWLAGKVFSSPLVLPFSQTQAVVVLAIVVLLVSAYAIWQAIKAPTMQTREFTLANLPSELDGLTIVQISDLHASNMLSRDRVEKVVQLVNDSQPDLIVLTGDMVDGNTILRARDVEPLSQLKAKYGVFGCVGNHEYYSGYNSWLRAFNKLGINMLINQHQELNINGRQLILAGVTDPVAAQFRRPQPDPQAALANTSPDVPRIMLAHQPKLAQDCADAGADLMLSGHTHGGQILGFHLLSARHNDGYVCGTYQVGNMQLWVNPGAGLWNGFPLRLGIPAEVSRIVLRAA